MSSLALHAAPDTAIPPPEDAALLARFVATGDHQAFAILVRRHHYIVMGVCQRVLRDPHEIDDVFQATFLVLVRDAQKIRRQQSVASWLYGTAFRLAMQSARQRKRRREALLMTDIPVGDDELTRLTDRHDQLILDTEINALPERYRQPLVLKYLAEKSPADIATELGLTTGAVDGLLKRGKQELRARLIKRGMTLGVGLALLQLAQQATSAAESEFLIETTIEAGVASYGHPHIAPNDLISTHAAELAAQEVCTMALTSKALWTVGITAGMLVAGFGTAISIGGPPGPSGPSTAINSAQLPGERPFGSIHGSEVAVAATDLTGEPADEDDAEQSRGEADASAEEHASGENEPKDQDAAKHELREMRKAVSRWDFKKRNDLEVRLEGALARAIDVNFTDIPLKDAVDFIKGEREIEIYFDQQELSEHGRSTDQIVALVATGVRLQSVLRRILDPEGLDYVIQNEAIMITSREKADEMFETRVYRLDRLPDPDPAQLIKLLTTCVEPDSWNVAARSPSAYQPATESLPPTELPGGGAGGGGGGSPGGGVGVFGQTIVVRQSQRVHEKIINLLDQLAAQEEDEEDE